MRACVNKKRENGVRELRVEGGFESGEEARGCVSAGPSTRYIKRYACVAGVRASALVLVWWSLYVWGWWGRRRVRECCFDERLEATRGECRQTQTCDCGRRHTHNSHGTWPPQAAGAAWTLPAPSPLKPRPRPPPRPRRPQPRPPMASPRPTQASRAGWPGSRGVVFLLLRLLLLPQLRQVVAPGPG